MNTTVFLISTFAALLLLGEAADSPNAAASTSTRKSRTKSTKRLTTTTTTTAPEELEEEYGGTEDADDELYPDSNFTQPTFNYSEVTLNFSEAITTRQTTSLTTTTAAPTTVQLTTSSGSVASFTTLSTNSSLHPVLVHGENFNDSLILPIDDVTDNQGSGAAIKQRGGSQDVVEGSGMRSATGSSTDMDTEDETEEGYGVEGSGVSPPPILRVAARKDSYSPAQKPKVEGSGDATETTEEEIALSEPTRPTRKQVFSTPDPNAEDNTIAPDNEPSPDDENEDSADPPQDPIVTKEPNSTQNLLAQPAMLAAVIGGAVIGLLCAILLVMYLVYRMRKKDEGSYALDEPSKRPGRGEYMRAPTSNSGKEFYA